MKAKKKMYKEDIVDNLMKQKVLNGRVFDYEIISKPGMCTIVDALEIQSQTHLFTNHTHVLHEQQVRDFYYNFEFTEDGSINIRVGDRILYLNKERLGEVLNVPREGIRSLIGKFCSKGFPKECGKLTKLNCVGISKKLLKGYYQLLFEFVNKVLLPRSEKRTIASATDLFVMEALNTF
ncbi:hypothetical protein H5410_056226 [Solanum commersonii]|uniref:Uncharacterized protein n=1 Tax=Solanum commersonii TaxID=4109 RepID=A0A9J5WLM5_SOLCO|nr:hypothetical protein H5410_056226 [Solanum commersonii]